MENGFVKEFLTVNSDGGLISLAVVPGRLLSIDPENILSVVKIIKKRAGLKDCPEIPVGAKIAKGASEEVVCANVIPGKNHTLQVTVLKRGGNFYKVERTSYSGAFPWPKDTIWLCGL